MILTYTFVLAVCFTGNGSPASACVNAVFHTQQACESAKAAIVKDATDKWFRITVARCFADPQEPQP
jgi:hypothetical protein